MFDYYRVLFFWVLFNVAGYKKEASFYLKFKINSSIQVFYYNNDSDGYNEN